MTALESRRRYVLGRDVMTDKVSDLYHMALIIRLEYYAMNWEEWVSWATTN